MSEEIVLDILILVFYNCIPNTSYNQQSSTSSEAFQRVQVL